MNKAEQVFIKLSGLSKKYIYKRSEEPKQGRVHIEADKYYGRAFKLVKSPDGQQQIVTPINGPNWYYPEVKNKKQIQEVKDLINNKKQIPSHKYHQIIDTIKNLKVKK